MSKKKFTARGFRVDEFKDIYGAPCSIQESSLATSRAIWLGLEEGSHSTENGGIVKTTGLICCARMHVDKKLARWLIKKLERFVATGTI